ncbi:MAG TPA: ABC transporter permease [Bacteroidales bacterium]|nr:ABC transporter permease [Bacteroidales bacterium]
MNLLKPIGVYLLLMRQVLSRPDRWRIFFKRLSTELYAIGVDSFGIVAIISLFTGAVVAIQVAYNIDNPLLPKTLIGFSTRQMIVLEFAPTMISLILAGKVGSSIASEIGTMRITEQIDALDIMGINSANFLIFPKLVAAVLINPVLIIFGMYIGIVGGYFVSTFTNLLTPSEFIGGVQLDFESFTVFYALIKTVVFAIIIITIAGFQGYIVKGGSIQVGKASTKTVVYSSVLIILFNLLLTQIFLT